MPASKRQRAAAESKAAKLTTLAARGDRIVAKSTLLRQERDMANAAHKAILEYLRLVRRGVFHTAVRAAAPLGPHQDPEDESDLGDDLDVNGLDQSAAWPDILARTILPEITTIITGLGPQQLMPAAVTQINAWRTQWLTARTVALAGVPDTITAQIRTAIADSSDEHGPNPARAAAAVKDLLNPDAPTWKSRAQTIARTEVIGANNQGGLASWGAVHQSLAPLGGQVFKTWLATEDAHTRPEHAAVDGTEMPIGGTFSVGDAQMDGPGDESADASLTINCRCTLTYRVDDGAGADVSADDSAVDDSITAAAPEAPVTAPSLDAPPQPADGTPSEAAPAAPAGAMQWAGVLAELDVPTPECPSRMIASKGLTFRTLPLPLKYQAMGSHGGEEAGQTEIVGRILTAEIRGSQLWATGDFFDPMASVAPTLAIQQVAAGIGGISVDLPVRNVVYYAPAPDGTLIPIDPNQYLGDYNAIVEVAEQSELAAATICDVPAFGAARIEMVTSAPSSAPNLAPVTADAASPQDPILTTEDVTFPDGTVLMVGDQVNVIDSDSGQTTGLIESIDPATNTVTIAVEDPTDPGSTSTISVDAGQLDPVTSMTNESDAASGAASGASLAPPTLAAAGFAALDEQHVYPADWFDPVALDGPTALTITDDGRVYGHLAAFGTCHTGYQECVAPPSSPSGYAYFHVGEVETSAGSLPVGKLTVGGGHAQPRASWRGAAEHYDNAGSAVAVVRAHEDEYGIQVTGAIIPTASKDQVAALRRSPLSGDWRSIGGQHELVAALSVNVPGFPVPRVALAADGRKFESLVAAGVIHGPTGDGEPEPAGLTLPSGTHLSGADLAVLAAGYADIMEQRAAKAVQDGKRAAEARDLRLSLLNRKLRAV